MTTMHTCALVLFLFARDSLAGESELRLNHVDGLPGNTVQAIAELGDGTMAFGTTHGLAFWREGQLTRTITGPYYDPLLERVASGNSVLPSNSVTALVCTKGGVLWIGTAEGLARYAQGTLVDVTDSLPPTWRPDDPRTRFSGNRPNCWTILGPSDRHVVTALFEDSKGRILIGTRNAGIISYDSQADSYELLHRIPDSNKWVTAFHQAQDDTLWISVFHHGILKYDGAHITLLSQPQDWVPANEVRALCVDSMGALWVGTHHGLGLLRPDGSTQVFTDEDTLPSNDVWHLATDRHGRVWAMTSSGPAVYEKKDLVYPAIPAGRLQQCRLSFQASDGARWIADGDGVVRYERNRWTMQRPATVAALAAKAHIEETYPDCETGDKAVIDRAGKVWSLIDHRLLVYDGRTWADKSGLVEDRHRLRFLRRPRDGRILVGTAGEGFVVVDEDHVTRYNNTPDHSKSVIYDMAESPDGTVFIGTQNGLYSLADGQVERLTDEYQVTSLVVDRAGAIWFADPNHGLILYSQGKVTPLFPNSELGGYRINGLTLTAHGTLRVEAARTSTKGVALATFECDGHSITRMPDEMTSSPPKNGV